MNIGKLCCSDEDVLFICVKFTEAEEKATAGDLKEATVCVMQGLDLQKQYLHPDNRKIAQTHDFCGMLLARQGIGRVFLANVVATFQFDILQQSTRNR